MEEFNFILKSHNLNKKQFCSILGLNYNSFKVSTAKKSKTPTWIKTFVFGYKLALGLAK